MLLGAAAAEFAVLGRLGERTTSVLFALEGLLRAHTELRVHGVFSRWEAIVGPEIGQHVRPESFADGRLVVRTDSTAWATQMKLLAADVVAQAFARPTAQQR